MKLRLLLNRSEITTLANLLAVHIDRHTPERRDMPGELLVLSVLYEVQHRLTKRADSQRLFGGADTRLSLSRVEALALYCYCNEVYPDEGDEVDNDDYPNALPAPHRPAPMGIRPGTYEQSLLQRLADAIHQTFLA